MVRVIIRAFTADGYHRDILVADEQQVRMSDGRLKNGDRGMSIVPWDFPEAVRFEVVVEKVER